MMTMMMMMMMMMMRGKGCPGEAMEEKKQRMELSKL